MRTTALPGLLEVCARNYNYRLPAGRFFELSKIYLPQVKEGKADLSVLPDERPTLVMGLYGDGDFFTLKGALEAIFQRLSIPGLELSLIHIDVYKRQGYGKLLPGSGPCRPGWGAGRLHPALQRPGCDHRPVPHRKGAGERLSLIHI